MSVKSYYRWALLLPLALPALLSPLVMVDTPPDAVRALMFLLYWSVVIGGIPYVLFAAGFLLWTRRVPDERLRAGILFSPLAYSCVLAVCVTLFLMLDGVSSSTGDSVGALWLCGIVFGYVYVAIAEIGRVLLRPGRTPGAFPEVATHAAATG